jgi:hypothetical protein
MGIRFIERYRIKQLFEFLVRDIISKPIVSILDIIQFYMLYDITDIYRYITEGYRIYKYHSPRTDQFSPLFKSALRFKHIREKKALCLKISDLQWCLSKLYYTKYRGGKGIICEITDILAHDLVKTIHFKSLETTIDFIFLQVLCIKKYHSSLIDYESTVITYLMGRAPN